MAMLVTLFLVLINIFNSVRSVSGEQKYQTKSHLGQHFFLTAVIFRENAPISSKLNAIDLYLVVCIFFVFGRRQWLWQWLSLSSN